MMSWVHLDLHLKQPKNNDYEEDRIGALIVQMVTCTVHILLTETKKKP